MGVVQFRLVVISPISYLVTCPNYNLTCPNMCSSFLGDLLGLMNIITRTNSEDKYDEYFVLLNLVRITY